jgi:pimeloyl-ACP methyl ester carboxylesterase
MQRLFFFLAMLGAFAFPCVAQPPEKIGVVVMHGKGSSPDEYVGALVRALQDKGVLVANPEMPWSGRRNYDADVAAAEKEVQEALDAMRAKGATRLFVAGHSQGGVFALHLGGRLALDGVIAIAPGGNVAGQRFREQLGDSLEQAKKYVAEGKGSERQRLRDVGPHRAYPVNAVPAAYVTWFDPQGAMNEMRAAKMLKPEVPVLLIVPTHDLPGSDRRKDRMAELLPQNPHTHLYEPATDHFGAPSASSDEIDRWMREVSAAK